VSRLTDRAALAAALALACALMLGGGCGRKPRGQASTGAGGAPPLPFAERIDGALAMDEVRLFVALGPKPAGEHGAAAAARYISRRMESLGLVTLTDEFEDRTPVGPRTFRNVIAVLDGRLPQTVILAAHYDTKTGISETFAGANDSGSGVGLLMELARVIRSSSAPLPTVMFAFFDGEECMKSYSPEDGLHGSRRLAETLVRNGRARDVAAVFVLDMIGDRRLNVMLPENVTPELRAVILQAASMENARKTFSLQRSVILDDHVPFLRRGMPAVVLIDFEYGLLPGRNDYWHTGEDTLDKLSPQSLETVGRVVLRALTLVASPSARRPAR